jgi:predicted HTH domain antitoxin
MTRNGRNLQASQLLDFRSRFEFERFLKERGVEEYSYSVADLDDDLETLRKLQASSPGHG